MSKLQQVYKDSIQPRLKSEHGYASIMRVPRLVKVTLNMGVGGATADRKLLDQAVDDLRKIAGQAPKVTRARKSEAVFKIRTGYAIGCMVTLRRQMMYEFVERLIGIAIPRIRDFRGLNPRAFDGRGNYSMGIKEQIVFPEIDFDQTDAIRGLDITFTTTAQTDSEGLLLLQAFNFPFRN